MSSQQITRPVKVIVATATTLLVTGLIWSVKHQASDSRQDRGPASHNTEANKKSKQTVDHQHQLEGKVGSGLSIKIYGKNSNGDELATADQATYDLVNSRFMLTGKVVATRHMAAQEFTWIFPQSYQVIAGTATGTIPELQPGQEHQISITLDRGAEPEQPVVLHVFKVVNSEPRGTIVQYDFPPRTQLDNRSPSDVSRGSIEHAIEHHKGEKFVQ
ncbi:MAG: hypothetical protein J0L82_09290 [Deltaproteobacteria bacterium]|jgi:hypothetical protein|nr:hypothetical protein [Deltaproteobacteria bacterium]